MCITSEIEIVFICLHSYSLILLVSSNIHIVLEIFFKLYWSFHHCLYDNWEVGGESILQNPKRLSSSFMRNTWMPILKCRPLLLLSLHAPICM